MEYFPIQSLSPKELILDFVNQIPMGKVSTYGQIATLAQSTPRFVARVLAGLDEESDIPWHRVINSQAKVSIHPNAGGSSEQRERLNKEGIVFDSLNRIKLKTFLWKPLG